MSRPDPRAAEYTGTPLDVPRFAHGSRVPGWDDAVDLLKDPAGIPDPATTAVPEGLRAEIEAHMGSYPDRRSAALPALAAAQREHGWCSPEAIEQVACVMRLTPGYLTAVATFYDMLETRPVGRHAVYVCTNISCSLCGADELYDEFRAATREDPDFNVRAFECLGACDLAPMASVDGVYVGPLSTEDVPAVLDDVRAGRPVLPDKQLATRLVADPAANTREWDRGAAVTATGGPHLAVAGAATPDTDPAAGTFGAPMGDGDRGEATAAREGRESAAPGEPDPRPREGESGADPGGQGGMPSAGEN